jgi:hypothetical protein
MKVELEKLRLGLSAISDQCFAGIPSKNERMWLHKVDVHNDFIHAVITKWKGQIETITAPDGTVYEISVKEIKPKKK